MFISCALNGGFMCHFYQTVMSHCVVSEDLLSSERENSWLTTN